MALDIFISFLLQVAFTVGIIFLFGWLIALCNKVFYSNFGRYGHIVCYITGFIGTPIHELSHALFCLIFGHKILEIKLFQISDDARWAMLFTLITRGISIKGWATSL